MNPIGSRAGHTATVARMTALSLQIESVQGQIATGKRVVASADDPIAFARISVLRRNTAAGEVLSVAMDAAARRLGATDRAVAGMTAIVERAKELALQGATGTLSDADRASLATEAGELTRQATAIAEARGDDGDRLFAGAADGTAFAIDPLSGTRVWTGHGSAPGLTLGGATLTTGLTGPQALGPDATNLFVGLEALSDALGETDPELRAAAFASVLDGLDGQVSRLADARAAVGARLARLEGEGERLARAKTEGETGLTRLEGLELTEAVARLQRLTVVLQAAHASFAKVSTLSLWDQLR